MPKGFRSYILTLYRNAINGRFVTKKYVETHPKTTEIEHRRVYVPLSARRRPATA